MKSEDETIIIEIIPVFSPISLADKAKKVESKDIFNKCYLLQIIHHRKNKLV